MKRMLPALCLGVSLAAATALAPATADTLPGTTLPASPLPEGAFQVAQADYIYSCQVSPGLFALARSGDRAGLSQCTMVGFSLSEAFGRVCYYLSAGTSGPANWQQYMNTATPLFGITIPAC